MTVTNRRRFSRHEYRRMVAAGILRHDEPLELLDGSVIQMPPIQTPLFG